MSCWSKHPITNKTSGSVRIPFWTPFLKNYWLHTKCYTWIAPLHAYKETRKAVTFLLLVPRKKEWNILGAEVCCASVKCYPGSNTFFSMLFILMASDVSGLSTFLRNINHEWINSPLFCQDSKVGLWSRTRNCFRWANCLIKEISFSEFIS